MSREKPKVTKMSDPPIDDPGDGEVWAESDWVCPNCKDVLLWEAGWWDDSLEASGACIGEMRQCGNCDYFDTF